MLTREELLIYKKKFKWLYILETQRNAYLQTLALCDNIPQEKKVEVIKDSAIIHLKRIFNEKKFSTKILEQVIDGCHASVNALIDTLVGEDITSIQKLIGTLSFHDFYTYDHSFNVSMYNIAILKSLKPDVSRKNLIMIGLGGILHDLGKVNVPTSIINSSQRLTDEEFSIIKKHPNDGRDILKNAKHQCCPEVSFDTISRIVYEHHENYNGTGYPNNTAEGEIHIMSRITAIADFFDAVTTQRSYSSVLNTADALALMEKASGKKLDPRLFDHFKTIIREVGECEKEDLELADDFDPCQPHENFPFVPIDIETNQGLKVGKVTYGFS